MIKLVIFPGHYLPHTGGLETHVDEFVKYLSRKDYEITIFTPNTERAKPFEKRHGNVKIIRYPAFFLIPNFALPKFWKKGFWKQYKRIGEQDVVMTRTRFFINSFLGFWYAKVRFKKKPLVHVEHGSDYVKVSSGLKNFIAKVYDWTLGMIVVKSANEVVAISEAVKKFLRKVFLKKRKIPIITRGVDFEIYGNEKDAEVEKRFKGKTKITFLGRLYDWKGVSQSIEAFKKLPTSLKKKSVFLIVGDGEDKVRLERIAKDDENIIFVGRVPFDRAINILNSTDVYLHSAYPGGGLSNSLLQAMYTKCLVVASPHEGAREVVTKENSIPLKNNSVESLNKGLVEALTKKHPSKVKKAKEDIQKRFGWDGIIEKYDVLLKNLVK